MGVKIKYGNIAPEAKENFVTSVTDVAEFVDLSELKQYNLRVGNYANPCELYQTILDGTQSVFPDNPQSTNMGYWSESISGADGVFSPEIVLTLNSEWRYSSQGLTFTFDTYNNIFPKKMNIKWYRVDRTTQEEILLSNEDFEPDSAFYLCQNTVEYYNKIVITVSALNMPYNRLKIMSIDYGYGTVFGRDELRSVKIIQEIDPISLSIPINTCDFTLDSKTDMEYSFQKKQELTISFNNKLIAASFVKQSKHPGKRLWDIQSEDYVGIMENITYNGGLFSDVDCYELLDEILTAAKIPHTIDEALKGVPISGHIPICKVRRAVQMICFVVGAIADTSHSSTLDIKIPTATSTQYIDKNRIRRPQNFVDSDIVTEVQLEGHSYSPIDEEVVIFDANEATPDDNMRIEFTEPLHSLNIVNGEKLESGANYAVINADANCVLTGRKYKDYTKTKAMLNELVSPTELKNVKKITGETLVSPQNIDAILARCAAYYFNPRKTDIIIEEGYKSVKYGEILYGEVLYGQTLYDTSVCAGDTITAETENPGTIEGIIISERYNLDGHIVVKECEMV